MIKQATQSGPNFQSPPAQPRKDSCRGESFSNFRIQVVSLKVAAFRMEHDSSAGGSTNIILALRIRTGRRDIILSTEMLRVAAKHDELAEEVLMSHDRIDNLGHCNRQATNIEGAVNTALQRIRITEEAIRNIHLSNSETCFQILEATCEHLTVRANRLATRIADFERLLSAYRIS